MSTLDDDDPGDQHVVPLMDLRPHISSRRCWCHPDEDALIPCLVIHHAMDGREKHEDGADLH